MEEEIALGGIAGMFGGGLLQIVAFVPIVVIHIISIVKAFQKGSTLWGVLGLLVPLCSTIFLFINKNRGLAIGHIICFILVIVGGIMSIAGAVSAGGGMEAILEEAGTVQ